MVNSERLLRNVPDKVGVYLLKDGASNILYIGKALSLRNRVREHLLGAGDPREKLIRDKTEEVEFLVTENEAEALFLENNLIKRHCPPYNIRFKDDKSYPSLKVTLQEDYPAIYVTRELVEDGSRYFGPYASAGGLRRVARYAQRLFGLRNCREPISTEILRRPCLNYQIGMCSAPCAAKIGKDEYQKSVRQLCLFLEGKIDELVADLEADMKHYAESLQFEKAAIARDRLNAVKKVIQRQRVSRILEGDMDVVGTAVKRSRACIQLMFVRDGNLVGGDHFAVNVPLGSTPSEVLTAFVEQRYLQRKDVPSKILVSHRLAETGFIGDWLTRKGVHSKITTATNDLEAELTKLVLRNAEEKLQVEAGEGIPKALIELQETLGLEKVPMRIEGIDVSNLGGEDAVGALVTFIRGKADKKGYRRYRIRAVNGIDDYAMIKEVVRRRYERVRREAMKRPDLVLIDGGRGHLRSAVEQLESSGIDVPVISIAKKREEVFVPGEMDPLQLEDNPDALRLIKKVRDEAHRFAVKYHQKLRLKRTKRSLLTEIAGIGERRRRRLLRRFGSLENLRRASAEEIAETASVSRALAKRVHEFLKEKNRDLTEP